MARTIEDLKKLSIKELQEQVIELKKQLVEQKRSRAARELANPHAIKKTRRQIAVALTLINEQTKQAESKPEKITNLPNKSAQLKKEEA